LTSGSGFPQQIQRKAAAERLAKSTRPWTFAPGWFATQISI